MNNIHTTEELAEDTFFRLVTRKPRFAAKYSFKTWLYTIGRNIAINHVKHFGRVIDIPFEDLESIQNDEDALEKSYIREEQKIMLHKALSKIKHDYSQVLYLKFFEDLTNEQIAVVMKKSKRQIENLIYQAKQSLKSELDKEGFYYEGL